MFYDPVKILLYVWDRIARIIPDKMFLLLKYRFTMGYWMDFNNPKTFNEKI